MPIKLNSKIIFDNKSYEPNFKKNAAKRTRQHARIVFYRKLSSIKGCLPWKVIFHWKSSSTKGRLPPKVVFHQRFSSTEGCLAPKIVFHQRLSSTEGCLPPKVVFHQRLSSTKGHLPPKVIFHWRSSFINHNTLVDLIFVKTVNIPNLSLIPCLEMVFHRRLSSTEGRLSPTITP